MTDNEIIKALECCGNGKNCEDCFFIEFMMGECNRKLSQHTLDLINRQKAEIERLAKENIGLKYDLQVASEECLTVQNEAIKEFWKMLKRKAFGIIDPDSSIKVVDVADGDNLVKEMVGE